MLARRRDRQKDRQTGKHDSTKIRQSQKKGKDRETEKKRLSHQKSEKKYREKMKKNDKKEIIKESDVCRNRFHKSFFAVTCMKNTYCLFQIKFITEYTNVQHIIITQI